MYINTVTMVKVKVMTTVHSNAIHAIGDA